MANVIPYIMKTIKTFRVIQMGNSNLKSKTASEKLIKELKFGLQEIGVKYDQLKFNYNLALEKTQQLKKVDEKSQLDLAELYGSKDCLIKLNEIRVKYDELNTNYSQALITTEELKQVNEKDELDLAELYVSKDCLMKHVLIVTTQFQLNAFGQPFLSMDKTKQLEGGSAVALKKIWIERIGKTKVGIILNSDLPQTKTDALKKLVPPSRLIYIGHGDKHTGLVAGVNVNNFKNPVRDGESLGNFIAKYAPHLKDNSIPLVVSIYACNIGNTQFPKELLNCLKLCRISAVVKAHKNKVMRLGGRENPNQGYSDSAANGSTIFCLSTTGNLLQRALPF
jgi:hypothetical protein